MGYSLEGDTLEITYLQGWNWFWMRRMDGKDLVVLLPESLEGSLHSVELDLVSARADLTGLSADELEVKTVSGPVTGSDLLAKQADFDTVSGKVSVDFRSLPQYLDLDSVSGRLEIGIPQGTDFTLDAETVSGTIRKGIRETEMADCHISLSTISGNMELKSLALPAPAEP